MWLTDASIVHAQAWVQVGHWGFMTNPTPDVMAIDTGGTPYVIGTGAAQLKKFNGITWVNVGPPAIPTWGAADVSMAINKSNVPYVVFVDYDYAQKATVVKFNGIGWDTVGSPGFSVSAVTNTMIVIDTAGTPYVAYTDYGYSQKVTVMKFNGVSWVTVGSAGFSAGASAFVSLALSKSGTPFVAYQDGANNHRATAMKFNGSSWVNVGSPAFSDSSVQYISIAIDTGGMPYVVYQDAMDDGKASCKKYNGTSWATVDITGFSASGVLSTCIAIDKDGIVYVAYIDGGYGLQATVMEYNGVGWFPVGNQGFSPPGGDLGYCSMALDKNGIPYVAYGEISYLSVSRLDTSMSPIAGPSIICAGTTNIFSDLKSGGRWSSSDTTVVSIDTNGVATGLGLGEVTISYTKAGNSTMLTIFIDSLPIVRPLVYGADSVCPGDSVYLTAVIGGSWSSASLAGAWISMDTAIASVTNSASLGYAWLKGVASGLASLEYIATNHCGTDTTTYSFRIGSCPAGVRNISNPLSKSLSIYPNPAHTSITISAPDMITSVAITNVLGETVYSSKYNVKRIQVDVANMPSGIYFVKVNGTEVSKFIKQ